MAPVGKISFSLVLIFFKEKITKIKKKDAIDNDIFAKYH
jgi:hypothetical protein